MRLIARPAQIGPDSVGSEEFASRRDFVMSLSLETEDFPWTLNLLKQCVVPTMLILHGRE